MKKTSPIYCLLLLIFCAGEVFAQVDYKQQFNNGKILFREGKYNLAMESFKQAIQYDANNPYSEYASFFYALSAYNQGYKAVAKDMFNQIKILYPSWNKMEELNFWMGRIMMDNGDYFQGLKTWNAIRDKTMQKDIQGQKQRYLSKIQDAETLRMMLEEYPKDKDVARALAVALSKDQGNREVREQLEALVKEFNFDRKNFITEAPETYYRDVYSIAAVYPFMLSTLEPTPTKKRNQIILDLYEGMQTAVDTLQSKNIRIDLRAYDTEQKVATVKRLLQTEELKNADLIVGPFFPDENKLLQEFSMQQRINLFKPFTNNMEMIQGNEFGFLLQPSYETLGSKSGEFLADYSINTKKRRNTCMVFSGVGKRDSLMVISFLQKAKEKGLNVVSVHMLPKEETKEIINILGTPTEYDEWNNPIEFTLKKDSLGSIYVASDDALIYSKVISSVEARKDSIVVLGSENWLDQQVIDFEKFQSLGIVLAAPNYTSITSPSYKAFVGNFIRRHGKYPSEYARLGYELMLFTGNMLNKHGVYFQKAFDKQEFISGYISEGFNYQYSHDNQRVPFVKFNKGVLTLIGNR